MTIEIDFLKQVIRNQIEKPTYSFVNSERAFVVNKIHEAGYYSIANQYWKWACGIKHPEFDRDLELVELQKRLEMIDYSIANQYWKGACGIKHPEFDRDLELPEFDRDLELPEFDRDLELPEFDRDLELVELQKRLDMIDNKMTIFDDLETMFTALGVVND